ncbi:MAG TPA: threonine/serine dehydratase [Gemmatimonadaceae bacterium]|nr:threonine/serine dehydratase [Gemmatimonadaceae bacterium]
MPLPAVPDDVRTSAPFITADAVRDTARRIAPYIRRTPVIELDAAGAPPATVKLELLQHSGSFKVRGAFANLLLRDIPPEGVFAATGGNHGAAVAYAAQQLGIPATIFAPVISSPAKIDRIRSYGATLVLGGASYADALAASEAWAADRDVLSVHAFDQRETMLGQATVAVELEEQVPDADTVLVAVGGGGLLGGVAAWYQHRVRVFGVEPTGAPTLSRALEAGRPVNTDIDTTCIAADSLAPRSVGTHVFDVVKPVIAGAVLVSDDDIRAAQHFLWNALRIVAEPGGATAFAALLSGKYVPAANERVAVVISGGNTTAVQFT